MKITSIILVSLACILLPLLCFAAKQTDKCHCFQDRSFDPARKFAADNYLLTTVNNSLIASHFEISKRRIVMMKMKGGTANNDLLIGLYLSKLSGLDVQSILAAKKKKNWRETVASFPLLVNSSEKDTLTGNIQQGIDDDQAAELITLKMLHSKFGTLTDTIMPLDENHLSIREAPLVLILARHTGVPAPLIASQYTSEKLSWSEITHNFGLKPDEAGKLLLPQPTDK